MGQKIATCSYCGTRAALVFDEGLHELVCRACGAPLHEMKAVPLLPEAKQKKPKKKRKPEKQPPRRYTEREAHHHDWRDAPARRRRKPRRRAIMSKVFDELWDVVEDIFD